MAGDSGVIAEAGVLDRRPARAHGLEIIPQVLAVLVVSGRRVEGRALERGLNAGLGFVFLVPVLGVFSLRFLGPAGSARLMVQPVLGREGHALAMDFEGAAVAQK